jgi:hypothetical protein
MYCYTHVDDTCGKACVVHVRYGIIFFMSDRSIQNAKVRGTHVQTVCIPYGLHLSSLVKIISTFIMHMKPNSSWFEIAVSSPIFSSNSPHYQCFSRNTSAIKVFKEIRREGKTKYNCLAK